MPNFLAKILSAGSDKELKEFRNIVDQVNDLGPTYADMDD